MSFFIAATSLTQIHQGAAPGQAAAEAHHQTREPGPTFPRSWSSLMTRGMLGGGGVAVGLDVLVVLLRRDVVFFCRQVDDPGVGLMKDEEVHVLDLHVRPLEHLVDAVGHRLDGELEGGLAVHEDAGRSAFSAPVTPSMSGSPWQPRTAWMEG